MSRFRFIVLSLVLDALFVNVSIVGAFFLRFAGELPAFNFGAYLGLWPLITALYLGSGYVFGLYEPERTRGRWEIGRATLQAITLGTVLTVAVAFFAGPRFFSFSRLVIVIAWALEFAFLLGWRMALYKIFSTLWPEQRVLIVGTGPIAAEMGAELARQHGWNSTVVGFVRRDATEPQSLAATPVLGGFADIGALVAAERVNRVIVASPVAIRELIEELMLAARGGVRLEVIPELYEILIGTVDSTVSDIPLMELTRASVPGWSVSAKRLLDAVFSLVLTIVLSPVLIVVSLAILVTMGRPVLFIQERVGRNLEPFGVIKFRTMVRDAEAATGPVLADEDDPRVTRLGRFMRRYRIDELPQLANILMGEMSFVGPRPERPYFVERFMRDIPAYRERFKVKPGVTGLAQVSGGYATTPDRKLKFDLMYVYHQTLLMDLQILVETARVVLTGRGAR